MSVSRAFEFAEAPESPREGLNPEAGRESLPNGCPESPLGLNRDGPRLSGSHCVHSKASHTPKLGLGPSTRPGSSRGDPSRTQFGALY